MEELIVSQVTTSKRFLQIAYMQCMVGNGPSVVEWSPFKYTTNALTLQNINNLFFSS